VPADEQVVVGRRDVDDARAKELPVLGDDGGQRAVAIEDRREQAAARGGDVEHDADRRRQIRGQIADDAT